MGLWSMHVTSDDSEQRKDPIVMNSFRSCWRDHWCCYYQYLPLCLAVIFNFFSFCTPTDEILGRLLLRSLFKIQEFHLVWVCSTFLTQDTLSGIFSLHCAQCQWLDGIFLHSFPCACPPSHLKMAAQNNQLQKEIEAELAYKQFTRCTGSKILDETTSVSHLI